MTDDESERLGITTMGERVKLMILIDAIRKNHFAAITQWVAEHKTSPMIREPMASQPLIQCKTLHSAITAWKEKHQHR